MKCAATGWGVTDKFGTQIPDALNEVAVRLIEKEQCENIHSDYQGQLSDEMLCAGYKEGGRDACLGDSGGPLACQIEENGPYVLYGITSWGIGCGDPLHPGVYTRVTALMDWVKGKRNKIQLNSSQIHSQICCLPFEKFSAKSFKSKSKQNFRSKVSQ